MYRFSIFTPLSLRSSTSPTGAHFGLAGQISSMRSYGEAEMVHWEGIVYDPAFVGEDVDKALKLEQRNSG
jgi:hypothetical protein